MTESTLPYDGKNPDRAIGVDDRGELAYSGASREGCVSVMLPSLPGAPRETETLLARDFGAHVASRIESALGRQGYLKSGPTQRPHEAFAHYVACAKGAGLLDAGAQKNADALVKEFSTEPAQAEFFKQVIRPWLHSLSSKKR